MPSQEPNPKTRLAAHLERWESEHLKGTPQVVIRFGKPTGPVRLDEFSSTRLTFQYAVNDLTATLSVGLRESLEYEATEVSRLELRRADANRAFKARAESARKRYVDTFKRTIAKLRSATDDRWNEYEHPLSEDEINAFTNLFTSRAKEICRESVSVFMMVSSHATNTLQSPRPGNAQIRARRQLVNRYRRKHSITMPDLARSAGMSPTAIYGMINGDRTRYSEEKLGMLLKTISVSPENW